MGCRAGTRAQAPRRHASETARNSVARIGLEMDRLTLGGLPERTGRSSSHGGPRNSSHRGGDCCGIGRDLPRTAEARAVGVDETPPATRTRARSMLPSDGRVDRGTSDRCFSVGRSPRHLTSDCDRAFGPDFTRRIREMGIRDHSIAPRSPW
jgi:hypothetical protein